MRTRWIAAFVIAAALASTSASTQTPAAQPTGGDSDLIWNLVGCLGLLGLLGLRRPSDNDGYTSDPI